MVKDGLHDAMDSSILTCGMTPQDPGDPFYDFFNCDPSLNCTTHIEAHFYTSKI